TDADAILKSRSSSARHPKRAANEAAHTRPSEENERQSARHEDRGADDSAHHPGMPGQRPEVGLMSQAAPCIRRETKHPTGVGFEEQHRARVGMRRASLDGEDLDGIARLGRE